MANGSLFLGLVCRDLLLHGKTTTHKRPNKDASRSGQGAADAKTTTPNDPNGDASRSGQGEGAAGAREVEPVRFIPVIMDIVMSAHVPLDATSHESISTLGCEGPCDGTRYFSFTYIIDSQYISIRKNQVTVPSGFRSDIPCGCYAFAQVHMMRDIDRGA